MSKRYQLVWWWDNWNWSRPGLHHFTGDMARIYRWTLCIGPLEIRRWA